MTEREFLRQRRVLDQSLTAHTSLAERLHRRQQKLTLTILVLSVLAGALAFSGGTQRLDLGFAEGSLPTWAGVLSTIVFALALIDLVVTWGRVAAAHDEAARRLAVLKGQFTIARVVDGHADSGDGDLEAEYWNVMNSIVRIPNRYFVALKAEHLRKIEQSKLLDRAPTAFVWAVRLHLRWIGTYRMLRGDRKDVPTPQPFLQDESGSPDDTQPSGTS